MGDDCEEVLYGDYGSFEHLLFLLYHSDDFTRERGRQSLCLPLSNCMPYQQAINHFIGLVVKASAFRAEALEFGSYMCCGDFSSLSHTSDLKICTLVATLPDTWHNRVRTGTGWPDVGILWLGDVESLICNFYLSVTAHKVVKQIRPWGTLECCWDVKQPTKQTPSDHQGGCWVEPLIAIPVG